MNLRLNVYTAIIQCLPSQSMNPRLKVYTAIIDYSFPASPREAWIFDSSFDSGFDSGFDSYHHPVPALAKA